MRQSKVGVEWVPLSPHKEISDLADRMHERAAVSVCIKSRHHLSRSFPPSPTKNFQKSFLFPFERFLLKLLSALLNDCSFFSLRLRRLSFATNYDYLWVWLGRFEEPPSAQSCFLTPQKERKRKSNVIVEGTATILNFWRLVVVAHFSEPKINLLIVCPSTLTTVCGLVFITVLILSVLQIIPTKPIDFTLHRTALNLFDSILFLFTDSSISPSIYLSWCKWHPQGAVCSPLR